MSLIYQLIVGTLLHLKRTCPNCKRDQIVPAGKKNDAVRCKFCGETIPPPTAPNR